MDVKSRRTFEIAAIPGDGVGTEVTSAALRVLETAGELDGCRFDVTELPWGSEYYLRNGRMAPQDVLEQLRPYDAILFGAVGWPSVPDHVSLWGLRLAICQGFDQYVSYRPARSIAGVSGPLAQDEEFDVVIVRENTEGEYAGVGGRTHIGTSMEVAMQTATFTRRGIERIVDYAIELARQRRRRLASITKSNAQQYAMVLWDEVVDERAASNPDIEVESILVDAASARLVLAPDSFDVIVASNLFGDILSDIAAAAMGSLGLAASANLDPERRSPSMFEPVHGSAPDIAGQGRANPVGAIRSVALMLDHLGLETAAVATNQAVDAALAQGALTPDIGGNATTDSCAEAVIGQLLSPESTCL